MDLLKEDEWAELVAVETGSEGVQLRVHNLDGAVREASVKFEASDTGKVRVRVPKELFPDFPGGRLYLDYGDEGEPFELKMPKDLLRGRALKL